MVAVASASLYPYSAASSVSSRIPHAVGHAMPQPRHAGEFKATHDAMTDPDTQLSRCVTRASATAIAAVINRCNAQCTTGGGWHPSNSARPSHSLTALARSPRPILPLTQDAISGRIHTSSHPRTEGRGHGPWVDVQHARSTVDLHGPVVGGPREVLLAPRPRHLRVLQA